MKYCPTCGAEINPESLFCGSCGAKIPTEPQQVNPSAHWQSERFKEPDFKQASAEFTAAITGKTNLIERVRNILVKPKLEWPVILTEQPEAMKILFGYVIILAIIPAIATVVGYGFIGPSLIGDTYHSWSTAFAEGIRQFLAAIVGVLLTAWVVDLLAPSLDSEKNFGRSFQLVAYSTTPFLLSGIFLLIPSLSRIMFVGLLYSFYLLFTGLPVLKRTPQDKVAGYVIITIICIIIISIVVATLLTSILGVFFFLH